ncbi:MAG: hypothetical protein HQL46_05685 [Gammaproteobacteria bacterium]|nr:hypothetical protein [Gammaproteobacteria bacterium]
MENDVSLTRRNTDKFKKLHIVLSVFSISIISYFVLFSDHMRDSVISSAVAIVTTLIVGLTFDEGFDEIIVGALIAGAISAMLSGPVSVIFSVAIGAFLATTLIKAKSNFIKKNMEKST